MKETDPVCDEKKLLPPSEAEREDYMRPAALRCLANRISAST